MRLNCRRKALLQYIDDAIEYGHNCSSKRGRKRKHIIVKLEGKEETRSIRGKTNVSLGQISSLPLCSTVSGTSTASEELPASFEDWIEKDCRGLELLRKRLSFPLSTQGSAFVPFKKK